MMRWVKRRRERMNGQSRNVQDIVGLSMKYKNDMQSFLFRE